MSVHLVTMASRVTGIPASHKLVLMCLAESARDGQDRHAWPGADELMRWSGLSRSRLFEVLKSLESDGWIRQTQRGQKYRRAVYQVFPKGCCDTHSLMESASGESDPDDYGSGSDTQNTESDGTACGKYDGPDPETFSGSDFDGSGSDFDGSGSDGSNPSLSGSSVRDLPVVTNPDHSPADAAGEDNNVYSIFGEKIGVRVPWCGDCGSETYRFREDDEGRPYRCPECHPLAVAS